VKLCNECHHYPSERFEECNPARCYCKCHDVADASPDLLAACKAAQRVLRDSVTLADIQTLGEQLDAAVAKAEAK